MLLLVMSPEIRKNLIEGPQTLRPSDEAIKTKKPGGLASPSKRNNLHMPKPPNVSHSKLSRKSNLVSRADNNAKDRDFSSSDGEPERFAIARWPVLP
jgi:hypothetical protein